MTKEDFKKHIEHPIDKLKIADTESCEEAERMFWRRLELSATIGRTLRLFLKYVHELQNAYYVSTGEELEIKL